MKKGLTILFVMMLCSACYNASKKDSSSSMPEFVEIVNGRTMFSDSLIICELDLREITEQLKFDNEQLKDNNKEYEWGVYFDNNKDGLYDISFSVSNWKSNQETERIGDIRDNIQSNIWKVSDKGGTNIGSIDMNIEGNKMILIALIETPEVKEITLDSKIKYQTYFNSGSETFADSLIILN